VEYGDREGRGAVRAVVLKVREVGDCVDEEVEAGG
jgi:hypothetical protein